MFLHVFFSVTYFTVPPLKISFGKAKQAVLGTEYHLIYWWIVKVSPHVLLTLRIHETQDVNIRSVSDHLALLQPTRPGLYKVYIHLKLLNFNNKTFYLSPATT